MSTTEPSVFAEDSTTTLGFFDVSIGPSTFQSPGVNESAQNSELEPNDCLGMLTASQSWSEVCEGILSIIVGICGLFGNAATIAVLSKPVFKETFHKLLICLACFDSLFIGKFPFSLRCRNSFLITSAIFRFFFEKLIRGAIKHALKADDFTQN